MFSCPKCNQRYSVNNLELWDVYESEGKETEFTCDECDSDFIITSTVKEWEFNTELNE